MRVLVTGGNGFIGSYVCQLLYQAGCDPVVFDHVVPADQMWDYHVGDVRDEVSVTEAVAHADGVIHLAAVLGSQETVANPKPAIDTNIYGAVNVMEACVQYDVPMSMTSVGNAWLRSDGAGTYTIVKECAADLFQMYRNYRGLRGNLVRPMNAYGPGQKVPVPFGPGKVRKILPSFICNALAQLPIEVYGDGEQISDMCYVADVASILVQALWKADAGTLVPIAEVGPDQSMTVNEVAKAVARECDLFTNVRVPIEHLPMRVGEKSGVTAADPSTLDDYVIELTPFAGGLTKTVEYYYQEMGEIVTRATHALPANIQHGQNYEGGWR